MRTVIVDKIASVTQACGLGARGARRHRQHPCRGRRGGGRRDPDQQVELQPARADERPHGQGAQGRHRRRRARPPQGAVRLLGPCAQRASSRGRRHPDAQHRRRAGHLRLGQPRQGQAVRLPRARRACCSSRTWASASACRRGSAYQQLDMDATLDTARRARGGAGRHLHGGRQDRRRLRHHQPHAPSRPAASTPSRPPASRCGATSWRWRMPARAIR